jgi:hypothetical protein
VILKRDKFRNKIIGLSWLGIAGILFWANVYSIFSNHRETKRNHSSGPELITEIPARTSFGDDLHHRAS